MLDDFIASATATPTPIPLSAHDAYDWWSDIWLPGVIGVGSVGAAAVAVFISWRSNRLTLASTQAAERASAAAEASNELARASLEHERSQAKASAEQAEEERRQRFADRVLPHVDALCEAYEHGADAIPHIRAVGTSALEGVANRWLELDLNKWTSWASGVRLADPEDHARYHSDVRQAIHTMMAAWVRDPDLLAGNVAFFKKRFKEEWPTVGK